MIDETPIAPSPVKDTLTWVQPRAMSAVEVRQTIEAFGEAAERGAKAGFDGVEILAGHGYLINQFLSRRTNHRRDEWGGPLENRARFLLAIVEAVRRAVGDELPVWVKINSEDHLSHGFSLQESCRVCCWLQDAGVDGIEVTGGTFESALDIARGGVPKKELFKQLHGPQKAMARLALPLMRHRFAFKEAYFLENARVIRSCVDVPLMLVGGLRDPALMERIVDQDDIDLVSMSRPFIREPALVSRWKSGDLRPATCTSCNRCFVDIAEDLPVRCLVDRPRREGEKEPDILREPL